MSIDALSGLLQSAKFIPSQNCSERPLKSPISLLVVHNISLPPGEFGNGAITDFFTNNLARKAHPYFECIHDLRVSSHLLIQRDGTLIQYVPFIMQAWHAGESSFSNQKNCNVPIFKNLLK